MCAGDSRVCAAAAALAVTGAAQGVLMTVKIEPRTDIPGLPARLVVCNVFVTFSDPGDRLLSILAPPLDPIRFETNASGGFHQELFFGNHRDLAITAGDLASVAAMAWDSYLNIGLKSGQMTDGPDDIRGNGDDVEAGGANDETLALSFSFSGGDWGKSLQSDPNIGGALLIGRDPPPLTDQHIAGSYPNVQVFVGQFVVDASAPTNDGLQLRISGFCPSLIWQDSGGHNFITNGPLNEGFFFDHEISAPCPDDVNGDGTVNVLDLIELLLCFGQPAVPGCESEDVNGDGTINVLDLIDLLLAFGTVCP